MNRQQKKCLIATVGFHLLLIVILFVGPGFFTPKPKPDTTQLLDVIPSTAVEAALNSGVKSAQPPPPSPPVMQPPPPVVQPPTPPQPAPQPVKPAPTLVEKVETFFKPEPREPDTPSPDDSPKPVEHKPRKEHPIKVDLTTVKRRDLPKTSQHRPVDDTRAERERADEIESAVRNLQSNFTPSTKVEMPGRSSVSYASYASIIKSIYTQAWVPPDNAANDSANIKVRITVANDGTVISSEILDPSGDPGVDASVQRTLDRVTFIAPFPDGSTEKQKTFIINFNLKAKRMLG
jgi:TonB family protein